jgi:Uma2 family endonuclease
MSTTALVSVADYLSRTEKPYSEYIDGVLHPKAMPTIPHARVQAMLLLLLGKLGFEALAEVTVRLSPTRYLVPDVVAAKNLQGSYPTEPVFLCVEILSPEDRVGAALAKCEQYHIWGVPYCWVIDPEKRVAWEYAAAGYPKPLASPHSLHAGEIAVSLDELFATLT